MNTDGAFSTLFTPIVECNIHPNDKKEKSLLSHTPGLKIHKSGNEMHHPFLLNIGYFRTTYKNNAKLENVQNITMQYKLTLVKKVA